VPKLEDITDFELEGPNQLSNLKGITKCLPNLEKLTLPNLEKLTLDNSHTTSYATIFQNRTIIPKLVHFFSTRKPNLQLK